MLLKRRDPNEKQLVIFKMKSKKYKLFLRNSQEVQET